MRAGIGETVLLIMAEKMASKTLSQRASRSRAKGTRVGEYLSGRGEDLSAIGELNMLGSIPGDREGIVFIISRVIF